MCGNRGETGETLNDRIQLGTSPFTPFETWYQRMGSKDVHRWENTEWAGNGLAVVLSSMGRTIPQMVRSLRMNKDNKFHLSVSQYH